MSKRKTNPLPEAKLTPPPTPVISIEAPNPTQATLTRLLSGDKPADKYESMLLFKWKHLSYWEQCALAYEWDLPARKVKHEKLVEQAKEKLRGGMV
jgi:hypothetical protein